MNKIQRCKLPLSMNDLRRTNNDSFPMNRRHHCTWKRTHDKTLYLSKAPSTTSWSPFHLTGTAKILCPPISLFHRRLPTLQTAPFLQTTNLGLQTIPSPSRCTFCAADFFYNPALSVNWLVMKVLHEMQADCIGLKILFVNANTEICVM